MKGQIDSSAWRQGAVVTTDVAKDEPVMAKVVGLPPPSPDTVLKRAVHEVKAILNMANVVLDSDFTTEYSHHYGLEKFRETGAVLVTCVNREYCKKILIQLPGQFHPEHYHKLKDETFQVLHGELHVTTEGKHRVLLPGETCHVQPGVWHSFWSETGVVFEEISTQDVSGGWSTGM